MIFILKKMQILAGYYDRILKGVIADIRSKYGGSVLGMAWVFIYPIVQISIYACLYALVFRVQPPSMTTSMYIVFVFAGMVPLIAFNEAIISSTSSLLANRNLLLNTVFPAELIPVRAVLSAQSSSFVALTVALLAGFVFGGANYLSLLLVPVFWLLLIMFAAGIGWVLSLISLVARDIQHGLSLIIMLLFIMSPFAYTPEMVPSALKFIIYLNPLSYFVFCFQDLILRGQFPDPVIVAVVVGLASVSFIGGLAFFDRAKSAFFDYA